MAIILRRDSSKGRLENLDSTFWHKSRTTLLTGSRNMRRRPSSTATAALLVHLLLLLLGMRSAGADSDECAFESTTESYASCFNADLPVNPCQTCTMQTTTRRLWYADYRQQRFSPLTGVDVGNSDAVCEPAGAWICPIQDKGKCCVVREEYSALHPYRQLCTETQSASDTNREPFDEATVAGAVAGELLPLPQAASEIGATLYMRGRWTIRLSAYTLQLTGAHDNKVYSILFDRLSRHASVEAASSGSVTANSTVVASSDLIVLNDTEAFDLQIHFEWRRWKVYVAG